MYKLNKDGIRGVYVFTRGVLLQRMRCQGTYDFHVSANKWVIRGISKATRDTGEDFRNQSVDSLAKQMIEYTCDIEDMEKRLGASVPS